MVYALHKSQDTKVVLIVFAISVMNNSMINIYFQETNHGQHKT